MGEKIVVGPLNRGIRNDRTAFVIDNDSFPTLINAYQWRGRVKRKRGTSLLGRLTRFFNSTSTSYNSGSTTITLNGSGAGNLLTGFSLQANGNIVPGSVTITVGVNVYTDPAMDGTLSPSGTINYATGDIIIAAEAGNNASAVFIYYPNLPVLGLEDFDKPTSAFPGTIAFDTTYSYNINTVLNSLPLPPFDIYDVSFYKNPGVSALLPGYTPKTTATPTSWNSQSYQQVWTTNYQGALWATNGITVPFSTTNIGMQFKAISAIAIITAGNGTTVPAVADITIVAHGLVHGDFVFINEVLGITGINLQTGYVTSADPQAANTVRVTFPIAILGGAYTSGGIAQYLTNRSNTTKDCLRFYDGDPTNTNPTNPVLNGVRGWVNFAPPLSQASYSVSNLPLAQYYLVGARMILPFKDRLVFLGPVVQSSTGNPIYLRDTVIYSQNGTAYYTCSFNGDPSFATTVFSPVLLPDNQTGTASAYFEDQTGFGGFLTIGTSQSINTASQNEDVLIVGLTQTQTKMVYSGNDIVPFNFFLINSEYGASSTFSAINLDEGVMTSGSRGYVITNQVQAKRFDLEIPDQTFQIDVLNNGQERVCSQRDFINEWVYFTYPSNQSTYIFPTQTLQYNYRDNSWAIFNESYTTYGLFKISTGYTWGTIGREYPTWIEWDVPWNAGSTTVLQPRVIAGNQQGFVLFRESGTDESVSLEITSFTGDLITSPNHCLEDGDYIIISDCIGTISANVNGKIFQVISPLDANTFTVSPSVGTGTYFGGGLITRMYIPQIQTKQFPTSWGMARKTRLGPQQYLLTTTAISQVTLQIFLSQNASSAYNFGNNSLVNSSVLYTCPESTNIGLTPANTNLQMVTADQQQQIWHRKNISLLGDTVQIGITLSPTQMTSLDSVGISVTITGATQAYPCVLSAVNSFTVGQLIQITGIVGMAELNYNSASPNNYQIIAVSDTTITIDVDSTAFNAYVSGGSAVRVAPINQFAEIELHGFILDVNPSQVLA